MRLANMISREFIIDNIAATTKEEVVDELLKALKCRKPDIDVEGVKELIMEREEIENTSYGRGFAFPHARTDKVGEMYILMGVSRGGLTDETPDGIPLSVVVLLLTPSHISNLYLQTLSAMATFARMEGNRDKIIAAESPSDILDVIYNSGVNVEKELKVKDIMTRGVATVTPEHSLKHVANEMFKNRLSAMAVIDNDGNLIGQITDRDLIQAALPDYKTLISNLNYSMDIEPFEELLKQEDKIKVAQLYTTDHEVTTMDTRIVEVAAMMIFKDLRRVFVTDNGKLVGILIRKNIVSMIIRG